MRITYAIEGRGMGQEAVESVEAAGRVLAAAVRDAHEKHGPTAQAHILASVVAPLRAELMTDGRWAVERGNEWTATLGGVLVTLSP